MRRNWVIASTLSLGLVVATTAAYWPVFACRFVSFDDAQYVFTNEFVLEGLSWSGWNYAWTTWDCANWHPLTWLSLELDGSLWRGNPFGFHLTNLVLHCINVLLLFVLLKQLTDSTWRSGCVAALFALHPLHVESVAWISERKDVLSTLFLLLTTAAYVHYATRPSQRRYWPVVILFAMGLLAKPMLVTLPILLLFLDAWPLNRIQWNDLNCEQVRFPRQKPSFLLKEKIPLLALAFADGMATVAAQRNAREALANLSLGTRIGNAIHSCFWYLQKTFVPTDLAAFYPHPEQNLSMGIVVLAAGVLAIISAYVFWQGRSRPHLIVGWLWFLVSLLPILGLMQVGGQAYADRYTYIPHIGLFVMLVWESHAWLAHSKLTRIGGCVAAFLVLASCGMLTRGQIRHWKDGEALWAQVLKVSPDCSLGHISFAVLRYDAGDYPTAIEHFTSGLRTKRRALNVEAHYTLGMCHLQMGHPEEAEPHFINALAVKPTHVKALGELSKLLQRQGREVEAQRIKARYEQAVAEEFSHLEEAVRIKPKRFEAQFNYGNALKDRRQPAKAEPHLRIAVQLDPQHGPSHQALGMVLAMQGKTGEALEQFSEATRLMPNDPSAWLNLGVTCLDHLDYTAAVTYLARAARMMPGQTQPLILLASAEYESGNLTSAGEHYLESRRLDPNWPGGMNQAAWNLSTNPDANVRNGRRAVQMARRVCQATENKRPEFLNTLAAAYAESGRYDDAIHTAEEALRQIDADGGRDLKAAIESCLQLYRRGQAFRQ